MKSRQLTAAALKVLPGIQNMEDVRHILDLFERGADPRKLIECKRTLFEAIINAVENDVSRNSPTSVFKRYIDHICISKNREIVDAGIKAMQFLISQYSLDINQLNKPVFGEAGGDTGMSTALEHACYWARRLQSESQVYTFMSIGKSLDKCIAHNSHLAMKYFIKQLISLDAKLITSENHKTIKSYISTLYDLKEFKYARSLITCLALYLSDDDIISIIQNAFHGQHYTEVNWLIDSKRFNNSDYHSHLPSLISFILREADKRENTLNDGVKIIKKLVNIYSTELHLFDKEKQNIIQVMMRSIFFKELVPLILECIERNNNLVNLSLVRVRLSKRLLDIRNVEAYDKLCLLINPPKNITFYSTGKTATLFGEASFNKPLPSSHQTSKPKLYRHKRIQARHKIVTLVTPPDNIEISPPSYDEAISLKKFSG